MKLLRGNLHLSATVLILEPSSRKSKSWFRCKSIQLLVILSRHNVHSNRIRSGYRDIIVDHPTIAFEKDIDALLWKNVFYKPIEDFRQRMKMAASNNIELMNLDRNMVPRLTSDFLNFLSFATSFYQELLLSVRLLS